MEDKYKVAYKLGYVAGQMEGYVKALNDMQKVKEERK